jgi:PAS domain S-box-containing protein
VIGEPEGFDLSGHSAKRAAQAVEAKRPAARAKGAARSSEVVERGLRARIATLEAQARRYEKAIDAVSLGICFLDAEQRVILCNRRYAEIYRLAPEQVRSGVTLREIVELRVAAGTSAMNVDERLVFAASTNSSRVAKAWNAALEDGRTIQMRFRPMQDGGWAMTHEDVTKLEAMRAAADERLSLQALIDCLPDNLWVKDVKSRFVIANQVTATRIGAPSPADLYGKTDLELLPPEISYKFYTDEQKIVRSGKPMIDMEEYVFDASGGKTWILTTKVPLRNERGEVFGVAGISRDITERKLADALRDGQSLILEMIATGAPLDDVLEHLVHLMESQLRGIVGSILLLDDDGVHLRRGASPSLPKAYAKAVDGMAGGPQAGPCGAAAHRREPVVVADIMADPQWADYKDLAAEHGLRSCWSMPILSRQGAVIGTFAMYSRSAREPTETEIRLVDAATRIAGIAIERKQADDRIDSMARSASGPV